MATQLKVTEVSFRSKKSDPPPKHKEYPHILISRDSDSNKMVMPTKSHKEWSDKQSPGKPLESLSISSSLKKWQEELCFLLDHPAQERLQSHLQ